MHKQTEYSFGGVAQPGATNYFGLTGAEANCVSPGKRPLSTMSPTIVMCGDEPVIALGASGGPRIISAVVQTLVSMLDLGMEPKRALAQTRIHHQWRPPQLIVERKLPPRSRADLAQRGHKIEFTAAVGLCQVASRVKVHP